MALLHCDPVLLELFGDLACLPVRPAVAGLKYYY